MNRVQLVIQTLDAITAFTGQFVLEVLASSEPSVVFTILVCLLIAEVLAHLIVQVFELLVVFGLVGFQ